MITSWPTTLSPAALRALRESLPASALLLETADRIAYSADNSKRQALPLAVALPETADQVAALVTACAEHGLPITARGRGTNTTGASVPIAGGVALSFERMRRIVEINTADRYAVVEPGVLNGDLQAALSPLGFFWPPDPTSAPYSTIGGNLACNAGGPRAVKYGACRDNVLALRAVDGSGCAFRCGAPTSKGAVGFDLSRLLIGSEGTLALITEATLKLTPLPPLRRGLRLIYADIVAAAQAVARIMAQPVTPCALEFMDGEALALVRSRGLGLPPGEALLLVEVDGDAEGIERAATAVARAAEGHGLNDLQVARDAADSEALWAARKALSPALRSLAPKKINEDVVVPVSRLPELIEGVRALAQKHGIRIVNFGHAGNGNIHVNLMYDPAEPGRDAAAEACLEALFGLVIALDGTLSGEHGIGLAKRPFMRAAVDARTLELMTAVKRAFDPKGLLNPGKLLPDFD
ncbi:FAD-binding oxidoreductase [Aquimonas voraii]|uniref:D-lactate dehydrogenase n=1 Tax=Aquimonas voraii TaxID=265719 RepID=A0A1G6VYX4_9GAMM|nr:FAD-linked oxidase C-terminal domain-containing protein [Aquimonas voraii]SDD58822.1 D-lactate dehydrogenase [Aquimonas voraii]